MTTVSQTKRSTDVTARSATQYRVAPSSATISGVEVEATIWFAASLALHCHLPLPEICETLGLPLDVVKPCIVDAAMWLIDNSDPLPTH
jgi:hypothetical protein